MIDAYLDWNFLVKFNKNSLNQSEDDKRICLNLRKFIRDFQDVNYFNIQDNRVIEKLDLLRILDPSNQVERKNFTEPKISKIANPFSLFFWDTDINKINESKKYGYFITNYENLKQFWEKITLPPDIFIKKSEIVDNIVQEVEKSKINCNSLIIIEPFLINQDSEKIQNNIVKIINSLINSLRLQKLNLTIICKEYNNATKKLTLEEIKKIFESTFSKKIECKLEIIADVNLDSTLHDRKIITNYLIYSSGRSFDFFDKVYVKYDTNLSLSSIINQNHKSFIEQIKSIKDNLEEFSIKTSNPIFEYIEDFPV